MPQLTTSLQTEYAEGRGRLGPLRFSCRSSTQLAAFALQCLWFVLFKDMINTDFPSNISHTRGAFEQKLCAIPSPLPKTIWRQLSPICYHGYNKFAVIQIVNIFPKQHNHWDVIFEATQEHNVNTVVSFFTNYFEGHKNYRSHYVCKFNIYKNNLCNKCTDIFCVYNIIS